MNLAVRELRIILDLAKDKTSVVYTSYQPDIEAGCFFGYETPGKLYVRKTSLQWCKSLPGKDCCVSAHRAFDSGCFIRFCV